MNTNVQITATKKEFKNGQNGFEVKVDGLDGKLNCAMNFTSPLKALRYAFKLSKKLDLQIDTIQLAALSLAYKRVKEAEQKLIDETNAAAQEVAESLQTPEPEAKNDESAKAEDDEPSPMLKQFHDLKKKHPDALLLFRCGDFYESYEDDARACAEVLGITLTKCKNGISMAGFPFHALDTYLPKLIRAGKRVAICDQIEEPKAKKPSKRGINTLSTPKEESAA